MASTKPSATARPSPTPRACGCHRGAGRARTCGRARLARDARARGRRSAGRPRRRRRRRRHPTGSVRRQWASAFAMMLAMARSSSPGSATHRGSDSGTSISTAVGSRPEAAERGRDDLLEADRRGASSSAPVWSRLMSSRLPTSASSRSVSSSIVARNSSRSAGDQSMSSSCARLDRRLDPASGVRRSWETARKDRKPEFVDAFELARLRCLRLELFDVDRARELGDVRVEDAAVARPGSRDPQGRARAHRRRSRPSRYASAGHRRCPRRPTLARHGARA